MARRDVLFYGLEFEDEGKFNEADLVVAVLKILARHRVPHLMSEMRETDLEALMEQAREDEDEETVNKIDGLLAVQEAEEIVQDEGRA